MHSDGDQCHLFWYLLIFIPSNFTAQILMLRFDYPNFAIQNLPFNLNHIKASSNPNRACFIFNFLSWTRTILKKGTKRGKNARFSRIFQEIINILLE